MHSEGPLGSRRRQMLPWPLPSARTAASGACTAKAGQLTAPSIARRRGGRRGWGSPGRWRRLVRHAPLLPTPAQRGQHQLGKQLQPRRWPGREGCAFACSRLLLSASDAVPTILVMHGARAGLPDCKHAQQPLHREIWECTHAAAWPQVARPCCAAAPCSACCGIPSAADDAPGGLQAWRPPA